MNESTPKNYTKAPPQIAEIFGFDEKQEHVMVDKAETHGGVEHTDTKNELVKAITDYQQKHGAGAAESKAEATPKAPVNVTNIVKTVLPYLALFAIGALLYYLFFTDFSFNTITSKLFKSNTPSITAQKQAHINELKKTRLESYYVWMQSYYFEITDTKVVDPDQDLSGNGLTNFQKYILGLSPRAYDTLGLGTSDTETLIKGVNPLTNMALTEEQKKLIETYIDLDIAKNKATLQRSTQPNTNNQLPLRGVSDNKVAVSAIDQPVNQSKPAQTKVVAAPAAVKPAVKTTTTPKTTTVKAVTKVTGPNPSKSPIPSDAVRVSSEYNNLDIDLNIPAVLEVPSLKLTTPIIFSQKMENLEADLKNGVAWLPVTALPGDIGTSYVSGHSSGYAWDKSPYARIFQHIDDMQQYSSFYITVTNTKGKKIKLSYVVEEKQEFKPDDQVQFVNLPYSRAALSTCWPIGGTAKRMVIFGKLVKIEK